MAKITLFGDKVETNTTIFGDPIEPFEEDAVQTFPDPAAEDQRIKDILDFSEKTGMNPSVTAEYHDPLESIEKKKPIGFWEGITENALFKIPVSGPMLEGLDLARIKLASIRLNTPDFDWEEEALREKRRLDWEYSKPGLVPKMSRQEYLDRRKAITAESARQDDIDGVNGYINAMAKREKRGYNFWGRVGQGLSVLPAWMFEFALTGGLYRTGSAPVKKLLQRHAKSKLLAKTGGWIVGSAVRTTVGMPQRTFANTMRRSLNQDEGWATAIAKGWGETFIEVASEQAGQTITGGLSYVAKGTINKMPFGSKFLSALQKAWVKLSPDNTAAKFAKKIATKAGYSNLIGEYGEERLATLLHGIVGTETFGLPEGADTFDRVLAGVKQDLELTNALSEVVVLSVPGAIKVSIGQLGKFANDSMLQKAIEKEVGVSPKVAKKAVEIKNGEGGIEEADKYLSAVKSIGEKAAKEAIPAPERPVRARKAAEAVEVAPEAKKTISNLAEKAKKYKTADSFAKQIKLTTEEVQALKDAGFVKKETRGKLPDLRRFWQEQAKPEAEVAPEAKVEIAPEQQKALDDFLGHIEKPTKKPIARPGFVAVPQIPVKEAVEAGKKIVGDVAKETTVQFKRLQFYPDLPMEFRNDVRKDLVGALEKARANVFTNASNAIWAKMPKEDMQKSVELIFAKDQLSRAKLGKGNPEISIEEAQKILDKITKESSPEVIAAADRWKQIHDKYTERLVERGVLEEGQLIEDHVRHYVEDYTPEWAPTSGIPTRLKRPFRGYAKKAVGTIKEYRQDQKALLSSLMEMEYHNLIEDFIETQAAKYDIKPSLSKEVKRKLFGIEARGYAKTPRPNKIYIHEGKRYRGYTPDIPFSRQLFPTEDGLMAMGRFKNVSVLPENIYNTFREFSERGSRGVYLVNRATGYWKSMAILSHFPSFNVNNMVGDTWMALIQHPKPLSLLSELETSIKYLIDKNPEKSFPELDKFIKDHNILMGTFVAGELPDIRKSKNPAKMLLAGSQKFSVFRESIMRTAYASTALRAMQQKKGRQFTEAHNWIDTEGLSTEDALGKISRDVLVDYGWVSKSFRRYVRGAVTPFGTWYFKGSKLVWQWTMKHPGKAVAIFMSIPVVAMLYNNRDEEIREMESQLPDYVRNRVHFILGENPDGTIRVWNVQLPQDALIGTKIYSIATDYSNRVINGEMSAKEAALKTVKMWGLREYEGAKYLLSPWIRFYTGLASPDRKDPYDKAPIYPTDIQYLTWFERRQYQALYILKCSMPFLSTSIQSYEKGMPQDIALKKYIDRFAGKGVLGIYDMNKKGEVVFEVEGKERTFSWDDVAKINWIAGKEMQRLGNIEDAFVKTGVHPTEFWDQEDITKSNPKFKKELLKIWDLWSGFMPEFAAEKNDVVKLETTVRLLGERLTNRIIDPSVMQKWYRVRLERAKSTQEKIELGKQYDEVRKKRIEQIFKTKPKTAREIELTNKIMKSELPWHLILRMP